MKEKDNLLVEIDSDINDLKEIVSKLKEEVDEINLRVKDKELLLNILLFEKDS